MELLCQEPQFSPYLYVNPEDNRVHLMLPIVSGDQIGLDNTCKTVQEMQKFFGLTSTSATMQNSALAELKKYKKALEQYWKVLEKY